MVSRIGISRLYPLWSERQRGVTPASGARRREARPYQGRRGGPAGSSLFPVDLERRDSHPGTGFYSIVIKPMMGPGWRHVSGRGETPPPALPVCFMASSGYGDFRLRALTLSANKGWVAQYGKSAISVDPWGGISIPDSLRLLLATEQSRGVFFPSLFAECSYKTAE